MNVIAEPILIGGAAARWLHHPTWAVWQERYPATQVLSLDTGFTRDYWRNPYTGYATSEDLYFPVSAQSRQYHPKEQVLGVAINGQFKAYPFSELAEVGRKSVSNIVGGTPLRVEFDPESRSAVAFWWKG